MSAPVETGRTSSGDGRDRTRDEHIPRDRTRHEDVVRSGVRPVEGRVPEPGDERSIPQLLRDLSREGGDLVRQEIELARTELSEKAQVYQRASMKMAAGGALLLAALLTLLWTVNRGLTSLLAQGMDLEVAVWLSPLILTALLGAIGAALVSAGRSSMKSEGLTPDRTKASLTQDKRWAERKVHQVKEELKHG